MPYKRIGAAAAALLAAVYLKFAMPALYEQARPVMEKALTEEQVLLRLPEAVSVWLDWN